MHTHTHAHTSVCADIHTHARTHTAPGVARGFMGNLPPAPPPPRLLFLERLSLRTPRPCGQNRGECPGAPLNGKPGMSPSLARPHHPLGFAGAPPQRVLALPPAGRAREGHRLGSRKPVGGHQGTEDKHPD